jgi:hypothetical protein
MDTPPPTLPKPNPQMASRNVTDEKWQQEQESKEKQQKLDKIGRYRTKFNVNKRNNVNIKSSTEELDDELHFIEEQLGEPNDMEDNYMGLALVSACYGAEYVTDNQWNPLNLDLTGLGDTVKLNLTKFEPILEEMAIKYNTQLSVPVEMRLAMLVGTTVMTVHAANKGMSFPSKITPSSEFEGRTASVPDKYKSL